jgi:predicted DNA-binding transcriptional regulator YafY
VTKTERLLYLINLIKSHHNQTSKELAEKCKVSERTIFRDLNSLASATFPIYYDKGYRFMEGAFLPTLNLTDEELSTLQFAFEFSPVKSEQSLATLAKGIYTKLEASRHQPVLERSGRSDRAREPQTLPSRRITKFYNMFRLLNLAIGRKKTMKIKYGDKEILIEPYALVRANPRWSVLAYCRDGGKIVSYSVNKIESMELTSEPFKSALSLDTIFTLQP